MEEPNLETLIRDLYNHARQNLSEDLVAVLLETAKQLPSTNERLLAVRLSGLVTLELLKNPKHPDARVSQFGPLYQKGRSEIQGCCRIFLYDWSSYLKCFDSKESKHFFRFKFVLPKPFQQGS